MLDLVLWITVIEEVELSAVKGPDQAQTGLSGLLEQLALSGTRERLALVDSAAGGEPKGDRVTSVGQVPALEEEDAVD